MFETVLLVCWREHCLGRVKYSTLGSNIFLVLLLFQRFSICHFLFFSWHTSLSKVSPSPTTKDTKIFRPKKTKRIRKILFMFFWEFLFCSFHLPLPSFSQNTQKWFLPCGFLNRRFSFSSIKNTRSENIFRWNDSYGGGAYKALFSSRVIREGEFLSLIPLSIIAGSLFLTLKFLDFEKRSSSFHDFGHLAALALLGLLLIVIIPSHHYGWAHFSIALCSIFRIFCIEQYSLEVLKRFAGALILFFIFHIFDLKNFFGH